MNFLVVCILMSFHYLFAQRVIPLVPGIKIDSILSAKPNATKIAMEPLSGHLYYATNNGNIYKIYIPPTGDASDTLRYTSAEHGITTLQGLCFRDSVMYLCGNVWSKTTGVGIVVKGMKEGVLYYELKDPTDFECGKGSNLIKSFQDNIQKVYPGLQVMEITPRAVLGVET